MKFSTDHQQDIAIVRIGESRMMYPLLADFANANDGDALRAISRENHSGVPSSVARMRCTCRASSVRPRLMRDFTVPSGKSS